MQKTIKWIILLLVVALIQAPASVMNAQSSSFQLTSPSLNSNGTFKAEQTANSFGCTGGNLSPELSWTGAPDGTKSFGLTILDMDAPTGSGFWHWVAFNLPAATTSLPVGAGDPAKKLAPAGTVQARNDAGGQGYMGACPSQGDRPHRYLITLYALKIDQIPLDQTASGALAGFYLNGNALAKTTLTVLYAQPTSFQIASASVGSDGAFKAEQTANSFGCTGGNLSPELSWTGAPDGTKSFGLTVLDVDAPTGSGFWHWVAFNLPAATTSLPVGAGDPAKKLAPAGTVQARNDAGGQGYMGACPSQGDKPHHYLITLYALKIDQIPLDQTASGALAGFYLNGNALARTTLIVTYGR